MDLLENHEDFIGQTALSRQTIIALSVFNEYNHSLFSMSTTPSRFSIKYPKRSLLIPSFK